MLSRTGIVASFFVPGMIKPPHRLYQELIDRLLAGPPPPQERFQEFLLDSEMLRTNLSRILVHEWPQAVHCGLLCGKIFVDHMA